MYIFPWYSVALRAFSVNPLEILAFHKEVGPEWSGTVFLLQVRLYINGYFSFQEKLNVGTGRTWFCTAAVGFRCGLQKLRDKMAETCLSWKDVACLFHRVAMDGGWPRGAKHHFAPKSFQGRRSLVWLGTLKKRSSVPSLIPVHSCDFTSLISINVYVKFCICCNLCCLVLWSNWHFISDYLSENS